MTRKTDNITNSTSIASNVSTTNDTPFTITLIETVHPCGLWAYERCSPDGTVSRETGTIPGCDGDVLLLFALALAMRSIPRGCTVQVRSTHHAITILGPQLLAPTPIPMVDYLPMTEFRRSAWRAVLPALVGQLVTFSTLAPTAADVINLVKWAHQQR